VHTPIYPVSLIAVTKPRRQLPWQSGGSKYCRRRLRWHRNWRDVRYALGGDCVANRGWIVDARRKQAAHARAATL